MPEPRAKLRSKLKDLGQLADAQLRPAEALLLLSGLERPHMGLAPYFAILDELAEDLRAAIADCREVEALGRAVFAVLCGTHGFRPDDGDDDDLSNANLILAMDRRAAVPGLLAVMAQDAARAVGLAAEVLSFSPHALLRLEDESGRRIILDPLLGGEPAGAPEMRAALKQSFGTGAELEPAHYAAMANRDLVVRLRNDAKLRLLRCGRVDLALEIVEAALLVAPDAAMLWREAGLMHLRLDNPCGAVAALEQFMARTDNAMARARAQSLVAELKSRMT